MIKFLPLGGADDIGASCFYLNISGTGLILDCGIHPRKKGIDSLPRFDLLNEHPVDFVFISHAHQDHIGSLPFLIQNIPHVIIYSTPQTKEIADLTLHNAVNILAANEFELGEIKIYTHEEMDLLVRSIKTAGYNETLMLKGLRHNSNSPIKITFCDAGHILGSAGILIEHENEKIFYTGDINLNNQSIMIGADILNVRNIDTLILETTYGGTESEKLGSWQSESIRFAKSANEIIHNGGSILIPVFALGKTQELLSTIFSLMKKRVLTETNIYTGGIAREISKLYDHNRFLVRRSKTDLELCEIPQDNLLEIEDYNYFTKNPGIVLASSGMMLEGTTSFKLLEYWLRQKSFAIYGVGYMDINTPGHKVLNSQPEDIVQITEFSAPQKVNCTIDRFYFPSHSKREELVEIVHHTNPKRVVLIHGDDNSKNWIGFQILNNQNHIKLHSAKIGSQINFS